jgi:hypothetical protein
VREEDIDWWCDRGEKKPVCDGFDAKGKEEANGK